MTHHTKHVEGLRNRLVVAERDPAKRLRLLWAIDLWEHLNDHGLTKKQFHHKLNERLAEQNVAQVSRQAVDLWLGGVTSPRPHLRVHIAAVLDVPVRMLFRADAA